MFKKMSVLLSTLLLCSTVMASVKNSIRVTNVDSALAGKIQRGQVENLIVEFREGDRLPVNLKAAGDLIASVDSNPTFVEVKKNFFLKVAGTQLMMSFDGEDFRPISEMATGSISANANADSESAGSFPVSVINVVFSAFVK